MLSAFRTPPQVPQVRFYPTNSVIDATTISAPGPGRFGIGCRSDARVHLVEAGALLVASVVVALSIKSLDRAKSLSKAEDPRIERMRRPGLIVMLVLALAAIPGGLWFATYVGFCNDCSLGSPAWDRIGIGTLVTALAVFASPVAAWRLLRAFKRRDMTSLPASEFEA
jgi:hypothetical protein